MLRSFLSCLLCLAVILDSARADIVINEVVTSGSDRLLRYTNGVPKIGVGTAWYEGAFNDTMWQSGPGPFGFGSVSGSPALGTNTQTRMQYLTPTLYLRKTFNVSAAQAASTEALELVTQYNDGFVVYVNGVELARRRAGPPKQFVYRDMPAADPDYNSTTGDNTLYFDTINLGVTNARLVAGQNTIAVHALNSSSIEGLFFLFSGNLRIGGASPVNLVMPNDTWKFFPGVAEPSGGLIDPTLLNSGRLSVPWGTAAFVDTGWTQATGPIGQGYASGLGTTISGAVTVTPSLYVRHVFNATAADVASAAALQLAISYDDGYVAYLNGVEVARSTNLQTPGTFVPRTAVASSSTTFSATPNATLTIDPAVAKLVEGTNVLAIQVHNVSINDLDIAVGAALQRAGAPTPLVSRTSASWKYKIGTEEPVVDIDGAVEDSADLPESVNDWVELHNNGVDPVSLNNWSLTDDKTEPTRWVFPDITIPAGGYLVVFCDGADIRNPAPGGFLHSNFKLDSDGEFLGLYNSTGAVVQQFGSGLPAMSPFHSYGRNGSGAYRFFDTPTPGAVNAGTELTGQVANPVFSLPGGIYAASPQTLQITCVTPGASIYYTLDGSEPTTSSIPYTAPISVTAAGGRNGRVYRAKAFATGAIPSGTETRNYIVAASPAPTLPVVALSGDETTSLYRPFGVFAIVNNAAANYPSGPWSALGDPLQYNNPNFRGQFMERPVNWNMLYPNGAFGFSFDIGLRCAGSPFTRPRFTLTPQNQAVNPNAGTWPAQANWPSMNFYMRNHFSGEPLEFPVIPLSPVTKFSDLRVRAGHNDTNPFIIDELMRRTYAGTGQQGSLGANVMVYVNGVYKNIYNICNHVREEFLQEAYNSDLDWDVVQVNVPSDGDLIAFQEMFTYLRTATGTPTAIFQGASTRLDMTNFVDYILTNVYGCTGDWPHNNWIAARERSTTGRWRFFTWDAEGAFGSFNLTVVSNNFTTTTQQNPLGGNQSSLISTAPQTEAQSAAARVLYTLLRSNPEFRLLCADRIQKHFFNGGALTDAVITARKEVLRQEVQSLVSGYNETRINDWINGKGDSTRYTVTRNANNPPGISSTTNLPSRRRVLLTGFTNDDSGGNIPLGPVQAYFVTEGLWPATTAPVFSQHGGANLPANYALTVTNPNAAGSIYYTLDGQDPRAPGGTINGTLYAGPITINQTLTVKARVRNSNGEWSPLTEAVFASSVSPTLLITEIMYHPPDFNDAGTIIDGNEFEFIEVKNVGPTAYSLFGARFTDGIDYAFPAGASIPAGGFVVIPKNPSMFAKKYPGVPALGGYGPTSSLNNAGEGITLLDGNNAVLAAMTYDDAAPWPVDADGNGYSLVPMLPNSNPNPSIASNWRLSGSVNGSPGTDDPAPGIPQIRITEILANSPPPLQDSVEVFNPGTTDADISGWYLSDDLGTPKKYRIPNGTIVPAGSYASINEAQFNTGPNAFAFSSNGDEAVLSSANENGDLTGLTEFVSFGPSDAGVPFGVHTVSRTQGNQSYSRTFFAPMSVPTFGAPNALPKVGPVIITEVQFIPSSGLPEFVEIRNNSAAPVPLFDPANPSNTWRITGINYTFPPGTTLDPGKFLIISANDPASFRINYNLSAAIPVVGPFQPEDLSNSSERICLQKPGVPYLGSSGQTLVPYIDMDYVTYGTSFPWPSSGSGRSLERKSLGIFGEDPNAWKTSTNIVNASTNNFATFSPLAFSLWQTDMWFAGSPALQGHLVDGENDGLVNAMEFFMGLNPRAMDSRNAIIPGTVMDGANGPYLTITFRRSLYAAGTTFNIEGTSDFATWTGSNIQVGSPINNGDGTQTVTYRDTVPMSVTTPRFMRVKTTVP